MLELFLLGLSNIEIAERLGVTPQNVSCCFNSGIMQQQLARRRKQSEKETDASISRTLSEAQDNLEKNAFAASQVHVDLLESDDESVKQRSANAILDRTGLGSKPQKDNASRIMIDANVVNLLNLADKESLALVS